ncbi:MAG: hypothetical protein IT376_22880 [Polyangiaceae bacterium]|nr:hypothetical protein [Polyangiaceae bacterium]
MSADPVRFVLGTSPAGYGGAEEVSDEQALAYAEVLRGEAAAAFAGARIELGEPLSVAAMSPEQLRIYSWLQRNWRRVRAEVNAARGWPEQEGGQLLDAQRCL